ncbi:hypothetical protein Tcan_05802 [Toxocara canis]|uniref:RNase_Zc3h12a domain-containing protein n=1 Tax=Toxocara canis TaxID=6265 RepID=A0A0B2ULT1_TOXCA|nr:hypothetical protein Tcan_05802 [Toxocara canis]
MEMERSAATSIWGCSDAASSGWRQMEKSPTASMERTKKSQLFKAFKESMHGTRASPWECDAKGRLLSVIVAADKALPYITGRDYDPLRPIFIDGPSIAHAYDDRYHLYGHIYPNRNHFDENALQPRRTAHRFPVLALVQTLFTFISRGHKTIVLMPSVYNERSTNRIICHDMSALIDDVKMAHIEVNFGISRVQFSGRFHHRVRKSSMQS